MNLWVKNATEIDSTSAFVVFQFMIRIFRYTFKFIESRYL